MALHTEASFASISSERLTKNERARRAATRHAPPPLAPGAPHLHENELATLTAPPVANADGTATLAGGCELRVYGCTTSDAVNYHPNANVDNGECEAYGCTDPTRPNYDPTATANDGTCAPLFPGCTDSTAYNFNPLFNTAGGNACSIGGCTDRASPSYNYHATFDDGTCATGQSKQQSRRRLTHTSGHGCMDPSSGILECTGPISS